MRNKKTEAMRNDGSLLDWEVSKVSKNNSGYGFQITLVFQHEIQSRFRGEFDNLKDAEEEREKVIAAFYNGTFIIDETIRVSEFYPYWLEEIKRLQLKDNSYRSYRNCVYNYIIPYWRDKIFCHVSRKDIETLLAMTADHSYDVARLLKTVITTSMKYALENHFISSDPSIRIILKRKNQQLYMQKQSAFTEWQMKQILICSKETSLYLPILFASLLGLRMGEIVGLKYSDVDYIRKTIHVQRQLGQTWASSLDNPRLKPEVSTKTPAGDRVLKLPQLVLEAIMEERTRYEMLRSRRASAFSDFDFICCSSYGRPRSRSYFWKPYKDLLKEQGLPNIKWHGLRHSYTTLLLKENCSLREVSRSLGHTKASFTADVYVDMTIITKGIIPNVDRYLPEDKDMDYSYVLFPEEYLGKLLPEVVGKM